MASKRSTLKLARDKEEPSLQGGTFGDEDTTTAGQAVIAEQRPNGEQNPQDLKGTDFEDGEKPREPSAIKPKVDNSILKKEAVARDMKAEIETLESQLENANKHNDTLKGIIEGQKETLEKQQAMMNRFQNYITVVDAAKNLL